MRLLDIYTLSNIKGLGDKSVIKILDFCEMNNINKLEDLGVKILTNVLTKNRITLLIEALENVSILKDNSKNEIDMFKKENIHAISIIDENYPELLKETTNPPVILYCKGNISLLNTVSIAVVGTRENTKIGEKITKKTVNFLVKNNCTIISGLAVGIDTIAHSKTLELKGNTIAVLPSILDIQPRSNIALANDILNSGGLLLSEQKPKIKYHPSQLVKRDRIQSGLAIALFAIETRVDGGTMYSVKDAIMHNRVVYTPNLSSFDINYLSHIQTQGILKLQEDGVSVKYSSKDYSKIIKSIHTYQIEKIGHKSLFDFNY